jgi:hypothetical protein
MSRYERYRCESVFCEEEIVLDPSQRLPYDRDRVGCPHCGFEMELIDEFDFLFGDEEVFEGEID